MTKPTESLSVQIRRRMPAPRDLVYEAWTKPDEFRYWMCPGDVVSAEATLDVRVGGAFRIVMKSMTAEHVHTGTYQIVDPPAKLTFTWTASNHPPTLVTVEFLDHGQESEIVITHDRFTVSDIAKRFESGWGQLADKLAVYLGRAKIKDLKDGASKNVTPRPVVSHDEWVSARTAFLAKEKEFTRLRDELNRQRRDLPWEAVRKEYVFEGPDGKQSLADLFDGRSQLIVYHFMFAPEWEAGCLHCSFWADNFNPIIVHLNQRDAAMIAVTRAPYSKLAAYRKRMGWNFKWVSSFDTDFNFDYHVSFTPDELAKKAAFYNYILQDPRGSEHAGISVFYKDPAGSLFHTYSTYARGLDMLNVAYHYLDLAPKGRDEGDRGQFWVRRRDEYSP